MNSTLHPPNSHLLSDSVIGGFSQPSARYDDDTYEANQTSDSRQVRAQYIDSYRTPPQGSLRLVADVFPIPTKPKTRKLAVSVESPKKVAMPGVKTRRERCRVNQARYRNRQRKYVSDLQEGIEELRADIYKLEVQKQAIVRCTPTNENVWNVVAEYFRHFRHGYLTPLMSTEPSVDQFTETLKPPQSHAQLEFLQATMASDVTDGALVGPEALLENWRLLSLYHTDVCVELKSVEIGSQDSLIATISIGVTITENTLRYVYPHLISGEADGGERREWLAIVAKLLNQRLMMRGRVHFYWDDDTGRVKRLASTADMVTPMLRLLGSLEEVAHVFNGALISPDYLLLAGFGPAIKHCRLSYYVRQEAKNWRQSMRFYGMWCDTMKRKATAIAILVDDQNESTQSVMICTAYKSHFPLCRQVGMATSSLRPLTTFELSPGDAMQRATPHSDRFDFITRRSSRSLLIKPMHTNSFGYDRWSAEETATSKGSLGLIADVLSTTNARQLTDNVVGQKRPPPLDSASPPSALPQVGSKRRQLREPSPKQDDRNNSEAQVSKTRRERCRINQARYRNRQRQHQQDLEKSLQELREDVFKLEIHRQNIVRSTPTDETVWKVAAEYFRLFRYGYTAPQMTAVESSTRVGDAGSLVPPQFNAQLEFLQGAMVSDVTDGFLCGSEQLLENWRLLSLHHKDVHMQLERLEKGPQESMMASMSLSLTITENTLSNVYPHLFVGADEDSEDEGEWSPLAAELVNQRLVMQGSVRFDWDKVCGRVVRLETRVDMLTAMLRVLGSLENVARVLDGARIAPDCKMTW